MAEDLWGQAPSTTYLRNPRIEVVNPLGGEPFVNFYVDREFLDPATGAPVASVSAGAWLLTPEIAAGDEVLGPLAVTLQETLAAMAARLYILNNPAPPTN